MGKYLFGIIVVLALLAGVFILGFSAGATSSGGRVCEPDPGAGQTADKQVCVVDGVRYVPEEVHDGE